MATHINRFITDADFSETITEMMIVVSYQLSNIHHILLLCALVSNVTKLQKVIQGAWM